MAGERHERSQTVQVYDSLLPPPFRPGCGLSGKRSSCALIGPCYLTSRTRPLTPPISEKKVWEAFAALSGSGRGTVWEVANGRPGGGAPVGAAARRAPSAASGAASMERADGPR